MNDSEAIKILTKMAIRYDEESEESKAIGMAIRALTVVMLLKRSDNE